ncbi:unnamed protein product [Urochloa humidicola]
MAPKGKCRGRKAQTLASPASALPPTPPPHPAPAERATTAADLTEEVLHAILRRLTLADLLRAALACHRWRRAASRALPRAPPLLGYFFHPCATPGPPPEPPNEQGPHRPAVFLPLGDPTAPAAARLSLDNARGFAIQDVHLGLVLLLPDPLHKKILPRIFVIDPASRRRVLLLPPPSDTLRRDTWRRDRYVVGAAVLSRAHPSRLSFQAVCVTIDEDRPRAWVATVRDDGDCSWRALPRSEDVVIDFDPFWFEDCVHAGGKIYWHIGNSGRMLALDPGTLDFSFLLAPAELGDSFRKYRIGELPEDGRLCIAVVVAQRMQLWVRGEAKWCDNGWLVEKEFCLRKVLERVPGMPTDMVNRHLCTWLSDIDAGRSGKVFIRTWGYGRYSFHLKTGKLERLETDDGLEHGDPIFAYFLAWPPAFLSSPEEACN